MQFGLPLCVTSERVRTQIDFVSFVVDPVDKVSVLAELYVLKIRRRLKPCEYPPACQQRAKIDHAFVAIRPHNLQNALNDTADGLDSRKHFVQSILPSSSFAIAALHVASRIACRGMAHWITA